PLRSASGARIARREARALLLAGAREEEGAEPFLPAAHEGRDRVAQLVLGGRRCRPGREREVEDRAPALAEDQVVVERRAPEPPGEQLPDAVAGLARVALARHDDQDDEALAVAARAERDHHVVGLRGGEDGRDLAAQGGGR